MDIIEFAEFSRKTKRRSGEGQKAWRKKPENQKNERDRDRERKMSEVTKQVRRKNKKVPNGSICAVCGKVIENGDGVFHDISYTPKTTIPLHNKCHRCVHDIIERMIKIKVLPPGVGELLEKESGWMKGKFIRKSPL